MNTEQNQFDDIDFNLTFSNIDTDEVQTDETINLVFGIDVSPSIQPFVSQLNEALNDFLITMQKSHHASKMLLSTVKFCEKVEVVTGFQPIMNVKDFNVQAEGNGTALYDGTLAALQNAMNYRENLENSGVLTKTLLFIITDGEDNSSKTRPNEVKNRIESILKNEKQAFSFTSIMFGLGNQANFEVAQKEMGIQQLSSYGTTGAELKKMIGFISQSISSASGQAASVNF